MCFSPEASIITGTILSVTGIAAIKKAKTRSQIFFAGIPFIFAFQQITEGVVWLSLLHTSYASWHNPSTYLFLVFAQIVWPSWVPFSILLLEKDKKRKKILYLLLIIGLLVSTILTIRLSTENIYSEIQGHHIKYNFESSGPFLRYLSLLYVISTVTPAFTSSILKIRFLGLIILISYIVTKIFYENHVISVWCFFAALISIFVYFIMVEVSVSLPNGKKPGTIPRNINQSQVIRS